jgi:hypothetical protein
MDLLLLSKSFSITCKPCFIAYHGSVFLFILFCIFSSLAYLIYPINVFWIYRGQAEKEFRVEVEAIGHVRHKNLVWLLGYCVEGTQR